jgi:hypothetical protein
LASLNPTERNAILRAERDYVRNSSGRIRTLERVATEQMRGHQVTPAGARCLDE